MPTCTRRTCSCCPGDAIGYVDFGIVGQLPDEVRESLTRYSWLLFRGDIDAAIVELMRWLSPTSPADATEASRELVRAHEAFFYEMSGLAGRPQSDAMRPTIHTPSSRSPS